jgi:hypothetical protein
VDDALLVEKTKKKKHSHNLKKEKSQETNSKGRENQIKNSHKGHICTSCCFILGAEYKLKEK